MKNDEYTMNNDQQFESLERQKKYQALAEIAALLHSHLSTEKLCESICKTIYKALRYPDYTIVKMRLGECCCSTSEGKDSPWKISKSFTTPDSLSGVIEICYSSEKHWSEDSHYYKEYKSFLDKIAILISGSISREDLEQVLRENIERNKELSGLDRVNQIIKKNNTIDVLLQEVCQTLPASWQYPESTCIRLIYDNTVYTSSNFKITPWTQKQSFQVPGGAEGCLEVYYTSEFPEEDEGPFLKEERSLLNNIAQLLSIAIGCKIHEQLIYQNRERLKELMAINRTTALIMKGKPLDDTLQSICNILPDSWQFPEHAAAKIIFEGREYVSRQFVETPYVQREEFVTFDNQSGTVEVYYLTKLPDYAEGPFLKEERDLLFNIARLIAHYINNEKGRRILNSIAAKQTIKSKPEDDFSVSEILSESSRPLKAYYSVKKILVISSAQDAYLLAAESYNSNQFTDPYHQNNIWNPPQFTFTSSTDDAEIRLSNQNFDIVFIIAFSPVHDITEIYRPLKLKHPDTQFFLVTKSPEQISVLQSVLQKEGHFKTSLFAYEDHPEFLIVLCKLYEDSMNCNQITAPTILLVDDSPEYYTPVILDFYSTVFNRLRNRPVLNRKAGNTRMRMLLTCNYEDSVHTALLHSKSLVAVFSDIEFRKNGTLHSNAGFELYDVISEYSKNTRFILHSTEKSFEEKARLNNNIEYLYKGSPLFYRSLCERINSMYSFNLKCESEGKQSFDNLGSFLEFLPKLKPTQIYDLTQNTNFLNWLKVHGLFDCVTQITGTDYSSLSYEESSELICNLLNNAVKEENYPPIVHYSANESLSEKVITTVSTGSLGGKGRNIAFLHSLTSLKSLDSSESLMPTKVPLTLIIRSDEYERILQDERLLEVIKSTDYKAIQKAFDAVELSAETIEALKRFVEKVDKPLAVRSSSLFEDSVYRPFAGSFETYIIPNSHPEPSERLRQLLSAIKRVYASPFKPEAQLYFSHTGKRVEEDRMAIVLQELVGERHGAYYYPQISGVAGSYNFYPVGHMKAEDGFAVMAFGLGFYVVEGRGGHRFSPVYPDLDFGSVKDLIKGSQTLFYAVNLERKSLDFDRGEKAGLDLLDIDIAEIHGTLNHCASVYDHTNDRITPDLRLPGPRIVDFADILKYGYLPLAQTIGNVIQKLASNMGTPVEIEFAINNCNTYKSTPVFYLLQVRPLSGEQLGHNINIKSANPQECLLYSQTSLGNGKIDTLTDVIIIKTENFDPTKTDEMVNEVDYFNRLQIVNKRSYIIIGPGRWGTRDKSLGIPVTWSQICNAKIVVEIAMNNFPLDASLGSHFFHNITVMKTGYIAITNTKKDEFINWDAFNSMDCVENLKYFKLLRSKKPLSVQLDGRNKQALITRV